MIRAPSRCCVLHRPSCFGVRSPSAEMPSLVYSTTRRAKRTGQLGLMSGTQCRARRSRNMKMPYPLWQGGLLSIASESGLLDGRHKLRPSRRSWTDFGRGFRCRHSPSPCLLLAAHPPSIWFHYHTDPTPIPSPLIYTYVHRPQTPRSHPVTILPMPTTFHHPPIATHRLPHLFDPFPTFQELVLPQLLAQSFPFI